jgi:hypothetical protein
MVDFLKQGKSEEEEEERNHFNKFCSLGILYRYQLFKEY